MILHNSYLHEDDENGRRVFGSNTVGSHIIYDSEDDSVEEEEVEYPIELKWEQMTDEQRDKAVQYEFEHFDWGLWNDSHSEDFDYLLSEWNKEFGFDFAAKDFPFDDRYGLPIPEYNISMFDDNIEEPLPWHRGFDYRDISTNITFDGHYSSDAKDGETDIPDALNELREQLADYDFKPDDPSMDEIEDMLDIASAKLSYKCREYKEKVREYLERIEEFIGAWCDGPDDDYIRGELEQANHTYYIDEYGNIDDIDYSW